MQPRELGRSKLFALPLALGGNVFGWTADEPTSLSILDAFVSHGFSLIDTANSYSRWVPGHQGGESEAIVGKWLKGRQDRERILIATKVGSDMGPGGKGLSRANIERSIDDSLRRLNTEYVDLYQAHFDDPDTAIEETLAAFAGLVERGKVRAIGASNFTAERLAASLAVSAARGYPRYETLQPLYNLYDREAFERDLQPLCLREGLGVLPYYSLASGFLTGKYRSEADVANTPRAHSNAKYLTPRGFRILDALDHVARDRGATPGEVAIAWLSSRPAVAAPIASATSVAQLESLVAATRLRLDPPALATLDTASAP